MNELKGKEVIGLKVISINDGKQIGKVEDLIYDPKENKLKAFLIDEGALFKDAKLILREDVKSIGHDAVIIESKEKIIKASKVSHLISNIARGNEYLTKTKIVTENGNDLGNVSDVFFDLKTGKVLALEVSQGIKNIQSGKKRVRVSDILTVGKDVTIVKSYTEEEFKDQAKKGGIMGVFVRLRRKIPKFMDQAKYKAKEFGEEAKKTKEKISPYGEMFKEEYRGMLGGKSRYKRKKKTKNKSNERR